MDKNQQSPGLGSLTSDLKSLTDYVYVDGQHLYFSLSNLIRDAGLPNTQRQRRAIAEQIKSLWPEVWILEEDNSVDVAESTFCRFRTFEHRFYGPVDPLEETDDLVPPSI